MSSSRAYTLVELMITVALFGIVAAMAGTAGRQSEMLGLGQLERARATVLLEYEADCISRGRAPDAAVEVRLKAQLPGAVVSRVEGLGTTTITVSWSAPGVLAAGRERRALVVFSGKAR